jgi:putative tryptophan/tyrosine transport system substrate-binding protein
MQFDHLKRRDFITLLGGAAAAWPLTTRAQPASMPVVGFIHGGAADVSSKRIAAFRAGLSEAGYAEGRNVAIEYHWLEGRFERLPALLADLVRRPVAVIATPANTPASIAAKAATETIPIVFGVAQDPVALGIVASLARPGGNATGVNFFVHEINAKRLALMHELLPKTSRFAVLVNPADATTTQFTSKALDEAARTLAVSLVFFSARTAAEIDAAFAAISREPPDALFIAPDGFFASRASQLATLAARDRVPASASTREMVEAGLLMSYGIDFPDTFRLVGRYVGRILGGVKPADLPVVQPTKFELVINLKIARALGIEVPPMLLARADEVIE